MSYDIKVNGAVKSVDVDGDTPLLWVLRDVLGMTGTKFGCGMALCGACTVHIDGVATRSCITPVDSIGTSAVSTIEAIGATPAGAKIQKAWLDREVPQCGYCQSGQIMMAAALLAKNKKPTRAQIVQHMDDELPLRPKKPLQRPARPGLEHDGEVTGAGQERRQFNDRKHVRRQLPRPGRQRERPRRDLSWGRHR